MHMRLVSLLALGATSLVSASPTPQDDGSSGSLSAGLDQLAQLAQQAFQETQAIANGTTATKRSGTCTASNLKIRREWGALSAGERTAYIKAVKCLQSKPPRTPASAAPGAKSRFDDFVATHINQTLTIHYTGNFLGWHRYFTWLYEQALIQECGYTGTQPYWDWSKTAISGLTNSPIFDGSSTSMSGNGEAIPGLQPIVLNGPTPGLPALYLPPGNGGGCITSGPFKDMSVNLGPASLSQPGGTTAINPNGPLSYNPRCLKRSLTDEINRAFANASSIVANILQPNNVYDFEMQMQGVPGSGSIGIHGGGHYTIGGDPGDDVFVSPGDPIFYLHHSMIDRTWWIWQMLNPQQRVYSKNAVSGTNTFLNQPPSANTTLQDYVNYGFAAGPPRQLSDLMSTVDGPFCYLYL